MADHYGLVGTIFIGGKEIGSMSEWSLEQSVEIKDKSFFKGTGKTKTAGMLDWSASCNGQVDFAEGTNQKAVYDAFIAKNPIKVKFLLNATKGFEGDALIESLNIDNSAEGEYNIEISVSGTGGLTPLGLS